MSTSGDSFEDNGVMEVTGKVLIATIIALCIVVILIFLFHIYARWLWHRRQQTIDNNNPNRRRQGQHSGVTVLRRGLDKTFLKTLPITLYDSAKHLTNNEPLECSVCLSQVEQGEKIRLLPKCNHAFHAECIDMWFHSHSTCPICRNSVSEQTQHVSVESLLENNQTPTQEQDMSMDSSNFPTNVLFWGDETEVSTLTSQLQELEQANNHNNHQTPAQTTSLDQPTSSSSSSSSSNNDRLKPDLVIDIPRQVMQNNEEDEDEKTPILSRMRSLRRILSSTSRRFNPFSPRAAAANNS